MNHWSQTYSEAAGKQAAAVLPRHRALARESVILHMLLRAGVVGLLVLAPLAFGATSTMAGAGLAAGSWLLLAVWMIGGAANGMLRIPQHPAALPVAGLLLLSAVHWVVGISADPYAAQFEWLRWLGHIALAAVALAVFDTAERLRRLLQLGALAGAAVAALGIVQFLTSSGKIYWLVSPGDSGWVFGPYVNRNHFAGLMELWMPAALALAFLSETPLSRRMVWMLMALVMSVGVVLSGSRGGLLTIIAQLCLLAGLAAWLRFGRRALLGLALLLVIAVSGVFFSGRVTAITRLLDSVQPAQLSVQGMAGDRLAAWGDTLKLFRRHWFVGGGLGSFHELFPTVRSFPTDYVWTHAHNDYLQFLAETGAAGAALALWMILVGAVCAGRALRRDASAEAGVLLMGLACAVLGFMLHGLWDFNFHVPANAANFAVLAALLTRRDVLQ